MKLVLIAGKARSGKSEAAKFLKAHLSEKGKKVVITEYSKYIKLFAKEMIGWDGISEPKPRKFLQDFGFYVRHESHDPDYFIRRMKEDLAIYERLVDVVIISDVRLPREITEIQAFHPLTIKVESHLNAYDLSEEEQLHETEVALDGYADFDLIIKNKSVLEMQELLRQVVKDC